MMGRFVALLLVGAFINSAFGQETSPQSGPLRCQMDNGTMLPSATICADDIGSCSAIFTTAATPGGTTRDPKCDLDDLQTVATQCAKTCGICCEKPEYDCEDSRSSPINCTQNRRFCTVSNWTEVMTRYCPSTCGLCNSGTGCRDQITGCSSMVALCENVNFLTYMQTNCQRSCGLCNSATTSPGTSCNDVATNCATNAALCNNATYRDLMTQKCAATCGRCGQSSGGSTSCTNANAQCSTWVANGFCSNSFYTQAQKAQYCASSCGLCASG